MAENEVIGIAKEYAERVRRIMDAKAVILFGSHARGTATKDSDIDIAVIVDGLDTDYLAAVSKLWSLTRDVNDEIEPVLLLANDTDSGFLQTVQSTGIAV